MSKHLPMWHQTHLCIPVQSRYGPFELIHLLLLLPSSTFSLLIRHIPPCSGVARKPGRPGASRTEGIRLTSKRQRR